MAEFIQRQSAKTLRLSAVALAGAVMALIWALIDHWVGLTPAAVVSAITSLVMLVAQFLDVKAKAEGHVVYEGEGEGNG